MSQKAKAAAEEEEKASLISAPMGIFLLFRSAPSLPHSKSDLGAAISVKAL